MKGRSNTGDPNTAAIWKLGVYMGQENFKPALPTLLSIWPTSQRCKGLPAPLFTLGLHPRTNPGWLVLQAHEEPQQDGVAVGSPSLRGAAGTLMPLLPR